ncbi:MAG TPA: peptidoglycan-binding protein [Crenalkalicoccus sp.]|nr:peptidoglycan-binding protein [Crenalkalicoccus sp.]
MASRRVKTLLGLLGIVVAAAAGAGVASFSIESPAEVAARTGPPAPSPILVPIERRVLSSDVVTRGTVRFGLPQPFSIAPSGLKAAPGLIATLPLRNATVEEAQALLAASGRPVFVLAGKVPAYRDLVPGIAGDDVRQLEEALARLGFGPGPVDGVYDRRTSEAVAAWYTSRGWEPFGPTREQLAAVRALERDWGDAMRNRVAAAAAAATAAQAVAAARAAGEQAYRAAALELTARAEDRRLAIQSRERGAPLRVESERARAEHAAAAAAADVAAKIADRALIVLDPRQPETARLNAERQLDVARAARRKIELEGELAVQAAEREVQMAAERVRLAEAAVRSAQLEGARAVRAALDAQKVADFDVKLATERAERLAAELEQARARLGVQVPADEVVFIPALPVRVEEVSARIGAQAAGTVLTVTDNQLSVDSALALDVAPLVKPGMRVTLDERALGIRASGTVQAVASTPGTRGVDGFHFHLEIRVDPTPARLEGFSVRVTIPIESTSGTVLAVPVSALSLAADGSSRVQVESNGTLEYVTVTPGLSAGGYVEVTPVDGRLEPGQLVVVGYKNPESGA